MPYSKNYSNIQNSNRSNIHKIARIMNASKNSGIAIEKISRIHLQKEGKIIGTRRARTIVNNWYNY
jgi:hypothetical protein